MSERRLDDWITAWMEYTYNTEPAESFRKWVAISMIASCLQRKCSLQWEHTIYPNLYIVLVGPSGSRKGTAMTPGLSMLRELGETIKMSPESVTREQLIRRLKKASMTDGLLMHASLTVFSEELTVFLGYNNLQLMADLCNWYDCLDKWDYETKNQGKDDIVNVFVNLIGATTPRLLQSTLPQDSIGGGLTSRMIFVYETGKGKSVSRPFKTEHEIEIEANLIHDLNMIHMLKGEFRPDDTFLDKYDRWYTTSGEVMNFADYRFDGYRSRRATHLRKLAMIINASRSGDFILSGVDFDRALIELEKVEEKMVDTFRGVGKSDLSEVTNAVITTIIQHGIISFNEILGLHYDDVDYGTLSKIIETLTNMERDGKRLFKWKDIATKTIEYIGE